MTGGEKIKQRKNNSSQERFGLRTIAERGTWGSLIQPQANDTSKRDFPPQGGRRGKGFLIRSWGGLECSDYSTKRNNEKATVPKCSVISAGLKELEGWVVIDHIAHTYLRRGCNP